MKKTQWMRLALSTLVAAICVFAAAPLLADDLPLGCYNCVYAPGDLVTPDGERCEQVGDGEYGDGIGCSEGWLIGWMCEPYGGSCYYSEFNYGGGGGGGGGSEDDGECAWSPEGCPAYCPICN